MPKPEKQTFQNREIHTRYQQTATGKLHDYSNGNKNNFRRLQSPFLWRHDKSVEIDLPSRRPVTRHYSHYPANEHTPRSSTPPTPPPHLSRRSSASTPPTPPPRGIIRRSPTPSPAPRPRLHKYPSVSFDLTPSPSSRGSSMMMVDL